MNMVSKLDAVQAEPTVSGARSGHRCVICGGRDFAPWRFAGLEQCYGCGHVQSANRLDRDSARQLQLDYFSEKFVEGNASFADRIYDYLNVRRRIAGMSQFLVPNDRVLEVGVGRGALLAALLRKGYRVEGLDLSPPVCAAIRASLNIAVHCASIEDFAANTTAETWSGLIACHVIEHFDDPVAALEAMHRLLKPGGFAYLAVPNVAAPEARVPGWTGYQPYHRQYFQPSTLCRLLKGNGFTVQKLATTEPLSGWFNAVTRTILGSSQGNEQRRSVARSRSGVRIAYELLRLFTGTALSPVRWVQAATGYGEELIVIARKT